MQLLDGHTHFHKVHKTSSQRAESFQRRGTTSSNMTERSDGLSRAQRVARRLLRGQEAIKEGAAEGSPLDGAPSSPHSHVSVKKRAEQGVCGGWGQCQ